MKHTPFLLACALFCGVALLACNQTKTADDTAYLFSYFTDQNSGLRLAYSYDGLTWTALEKPDGTSFLTPVIGNDRLMRDPSICQGPDGTFHMVWTSSWWDRIIGYASSPDLIHWSEQQAIPVMMHEPDARNSWAPELFYDEPSGLFYIFWATTIPGRHSEVAESEREKGLNHRIYYTTTHDFHQFSPTRLFFDQSFSAIDAAIVRSPIDGSLIMTIKNENPNPPEKNIRISRFRPTPNPSREGGEEDPSKSPREGRLVSAESPRSPLPSITGGVGGGSSLPLTGEQGGGILSYLGIPYSTIIKKWWTIHYGGQEPVKSNRDTLTFELACNLRHICGFSRELLDKVIPCYDGFPQEEKMKCIDSALKEKITRMPPRLHQVLLSIKAENADNLRLVQALDEAEERDEQHYINRIPSAALAMGVRDSLEGLPRTMHMPALIGIGPMIGALATGVRLDVHGEMRHLNLTAYIVGEAASNKSKLDALYLLWMGKLIREDDEALRQEQEYLQLRERRKNAKEQPQDPKVLIRCQSLRTSIAQLLTRLQQSQGKHLYSYTSEADQLSQNSSAAWANTSVLQRDAYDNGSYSTDFANGKSTGVVIHKVLWNMTLCCTPDALYRAHRNYTNGAITRLALARTPDNTYAPLSDAVQRSPQAESNITCVAELLEAMQGDVCLPLLEERCRAWLERIRLETLKNDDRVKARLRMRAPVTAMRYTVCFMLCAHAEALLRQLDDNEGEKPAWADGCQTAKEYLEAHPDALNDALQAYQTDAMLTLFDTLADYTLDMLLLYFRTRIEAAYESEDYQTGDRERSGSNDTYYSRLPQEFKISDAVTLRGGNSAYNATRMMLRHWVNQGLIVRIDKGSYRKLEASPIPGK